MPHPLAEGRSGRECVHGRCAQFGCVLHNFMAGLQSLNTFEAWKIAYVVKGWAKPSILETYEEERRQYAQALISFDKEISSSLIGDRPAAEYRRLLLQIFQFQLVTHPKINNVTVHCTRCKCLAGRRPLKLSRSKKKKSPLIGTSSTVESESAMQLPN
jgi:hypothetical protein